MRAETGSAILLRSPSMPVLSLPAIDGWLVGHVFDRAGRTPTKALGVAQQLAIASRHGRDLIERLSGSYLAFWGGYAHGETIVRDPSATLPVFSVCGDGWRALASSPAHLASLSKWRPSVGWNGLAHWLRFPQHPSTHSCLEDLVEIMPGVRMTRDGDACRSDLVWAPWHFSQTTGSVGQGGDESRIRRAIDDVVAGWRVSCEQPLLELSGGLDSSIIAAALHATGRDWSGVNVATTSADGDERHYARAVAEHCSARLREEHVDPGAVDPWRPPTRLMSKPGGMGFQAGLDHAVAQIAGDLKADLLMSGTGGDNVFCLLASSAPVVDAFRAEGLSLAREAARSVAMVAGTTEGAVLVQALRRLMSGFVRARRWAPDDAFLARDVRPTLSLHPWLASAPRSLPHGTWGHIAAILRAHPVIEAHARASLMQSAYPLLSQPVMEACLSVPSWEWVQGGRDRSMVRRAFRGRLPDMILNRRRKGSLITMLATLFDESRPILRTLLLDGQIARHGLLDRAAVERRLAGGASLSNPDWTRLLELADAELWVGSVDAFAAR